MSGPWYNVDQSGHGWLIEVLDDAGGNEVDRINAYWYVYLNGAPVWLIGTGPISENRADLDMFITSGPDFPPNYDAAALTLTGTTWTSQVTAG